MAQPSLEADLGLLLQKESWPTWLHPIEVEEAERALARGALEVCFWQCEPPAECTLLLHARYRACYPSGTMSALLRDGTVEVPPGRLRDALEYLREIACCRRGPCSICASVSSQEDYGTGSDGDSRSDGDADTDSEAAEQEFGAHLDPPTSPEFVKDMQRVEERFGANVLELRRYEGLDTVDLTLNVFPEGALPGGDADQLEVRLRLSRTAYRNRGLCVVRCTQEGKATMLALIVQRHAVAWVKRNYFAVATGVDCVCPEAAEGTDAEGTDAEGTDAEAADAVATDADVRRLTEMGFEEQAARSVLPLVAHDVAAAVELLDEDHELFMAVQRSMSDTAAGLDLQQQERALAGANARHGAQVGVKDSDGFLVQLVHFIHGCPVTDGCRRYCRRVRSPSPSDQMCVPVPELSAEFAELRAGLAAHRESPRCGSLVLRHAWSVRNGSLWERYVNALSKVAGDVDEGRLPRHSVSVQEAALALGPQNAVLPELLPEVNEHRLFHGTSSSRLQGIVREGLDERFSNHGLFGRGLYLAEDIRKADVHAARGRPPAEVAKMLYGDGDAPDGLSYVFVCRVALGYPAYTGDGRQLSGGGEVWEDRERGMIRRIEPLGERYTCLIVDKCSPSYGYREFLLPSGKLIYPEYLISYTRE